MRRRLIAFSCVLATLALVLIPAAPVARAESIAQEKIDPALRKLMQANPLSLLPVIVEMQPPGAPYASAANVARANEAMDLLRLHGTPVAGLALIDSAAGFANSPGIEAISLSPTVAYVHLDAAVVPASVQAAAQGSAVYPHVVNADRVWSQGTTGRGVTIAILDSGVAADPDLVEPSNRILASVNFADKRLVPDPGGHGTHVAGIAAGNGTRSGGEFVGVAPEANIVDVRVLSRTGSGRISSVVRGIEWVLAHKTTYNIRVLNLSFGAPAPTSYRTDPMSAAVEIAWRRGLVVVVAAGNAGPGRDTVHSPGIDPYAITVGATDDNGTISTGDDTLAAFSSWGSVDSNSKPDLVAPGRRIVSLRVQGSALDLLFPDRVAAAANGSTYIRLSGTSMSTPVVAGAVALLLERRPNLGPDQVKALLVSTTQPYGQDSGVAPPDPSAGGSGLLDVLSAIESQPPAATPNEPIGDAVLAAPVMQVDGLQARANRGLRPADAFARALLPCLRVLPLQWKDLTLGGIDWGALTWDSVNWDSVAWDNFDWDSVAWDSVAWDSVAWDSVAWDSVAWDTSVAWD